MTADKRAKNKSEEIKYLTGGVEYFFPSVPITLTISVFKFIEC